jgi:hypothetical protein
MNRSPHHAGLYPEMIRLARPRIGQPGMIAAFEKSPNQLLSHRLNALVQNGKVGLMDTRALDL